jgi:hypothetical protein
MWCKIQGFMRTGIPAVILDLEVSLKMRVTCCYGYSDDEVFPNEM